MHQRLLGLQAASSLSTSAARRRRWVMPITTCRRVLLSTHSCGQSMSSSCLRPPIFEGIYPILVTPFQDNDDSKLDLSSFRRSIRFLAETGCCQGVTILGVLGESNRLVDRERHLLIQAAVETAREINNNYCNHHHHHQQQQCHPKFIVCVGASHTGTAATVEHCQTAASLGADAVMVTPTFPGESMILDLYHRIADACPDLPIVLQDHPSSTGVHMSIDLLARIVRQVETVAYIKLESLPTLERIAALRQLDHDRDFDKIGCSILTGLGALYAGFDVAQRTQGFMTGFAFPEILHVLHQLARDNDKLEQAFAVYTTFLPLLVFEQQPIIGLAIRKQIYKRRGMIDSAHVRHPGTSHLSPAMELALERQLERSFPSSMEIDITKALQPEVILKLAGATETSCN